MFRNVGTKEAPTFTAITGTDNPFNNWGLGGNVAPQFLDLDAECSIHNDCNGHGQGDMDEAGEFKCMCHSGWIGLYCGTTCPEGCSGHGQCATVDAPETASPAAANGTNGTPPWFCKISENFLRIWPRAVPAGSQGWGAQNVPKR